MKLNLQIKDIQQGYATKRNSVYKVIIPEWAFQIHRGENYWVWYVCHELAHITTHQLFGVWSHNNDFKAIEDMYLADFGLYVERKRVYPKANGIRKLK